MNSHKCAQTYTNTLSEMDSMSSSKDFKISTAKIAAGYKTKTA